MNHTRVDICITARKQDIFGIHEILIHPSLVVLREVKTLRIL